MIINDCLEVEEGEVMGFLEVLSWAKSMDIHGVLVGGDAKK